jgi:hypothetical protein
MHEATHDMGIGLLEVRVLEDGSGGMLFTTKNRKETSGAFLPLWDYYQADLRLTGEARLLGAIDTVMRRPTKIILRGPPEDSVELSWSPPGGQDVACVLNRATEHSLVAFGRLLEKELARANAVGRFLCALAVGDVLRVQTEQISELQGSLAIVRESIARLSPRAGGLRGDESQESRVQVAGPPQAAKQPLVAGEGSPASRRPGTRRSSAETETRPARA